MKFLILENVLVLILMLLNLKINYYFPIFIDIYINTLVNCDPSAFNCSIFNSVISIDGFDAIF